MWTTTAEYTHRQNTTENEMMNMWKMCAVRATQEWCWRLIDNVNKSGKEALIWSLSLSDLIPIEHFIHFTIILVDKIRYMNVVDRNKTHSSRLFCISCRPSAAALFIFISTHHSHRQVLKSTKSAGYAPNSKFRVIWLGLGQCDTVWLWII